MKNYLKAFIDSETKPGILLFIAAILAIFCKNSFLAPSYDSFVSYPLKIGIADFALNKTVSHWIDDFLMVGFFLLVGLELKREFLIGHISSLQSASLPAIGAFGGMLVPALIYLYFNNSNPEAITGWAIPTATDIAFSLGVLSLLGNKIPVSLRVFLTTLAIFDDLGAILVIAIFYTSTLATPFIIAAGGICLVLYLLNRFQIQFLSIYLIFGILLWFMVLKSGIHATIAGVLLAFFIPLKSNKKDKSMLKDLEHILHPWVAYGILPLFAFVNSGISLELLSSKSLSQPIALGVMLGLFFGKQIGVFLFSYLAIKLKISKLPAKANFAQLYGVAIITGIGFTMSIFIGTLAFSGPESIDVAKAGTIIGSLASGITGYLLLKFVSKNNKKNR